LKVFTILSHPDPCVNQEFIAFPVSVRSDLHTMSRSHDLGPVSSIVAHEVPESVSGGCGNNGELKQRFNVIDPDGEYSGFDAGKKRIAL
jgi:hypothetical protein